MRMRRGVGVGREDWRKMNRLLVRVISGYVLVFMCGAIARPSHRHSDNAYTVLDDFNGTSTSRTQLPISVLSFLPLGPVAMLKYQGDK